MKKEMYEHIFEMTKIGNRAVRKAQQENKALGLPSVYSKNGKIYYELPDGTFSMSSSFFEQ
jgi:hypothetical protein